MIKAIFFNVDGTLLPFSQKEIPDSALEALKALQSQGIKVFLATERHPAMLISLRKAFPFDGYVTLNGQYVFVQDDLLRAKPLAEGDVSELLAVLDEKKFSCVFMEIGRSYANEVNDKTKLFASLYDVPLPSVADVSAVAQQEIYQVICFVSREEEKELLSSIHGPDFVRWSPLFTEMIPKGGGKELGLQTMGEYFNIDPEEMMVFGNEDNDVAMLQYAGIGVAMGNSTEEALEKADYVTGSPEEDGIYNALVHYKILPPK